MPLPDELPPLADVGLDGLSDHDPLAARPSPLLGKPSASTGAKLPLVMIGVVGGGICALMLLVVGAYWAFSSKPVAQVPAAPVGLPVVPNSPAPFTPIQPKPPTTPITPRPLPVSPTNSSPPQASETTTTGREPRSDGGKIGTLQSGEGRLPNGFSEEESFQPRTAWSVTVDPPETIEPPPEKLIDIDFKTKVDQLVFPQRPSPFFAAATNDFRDAHIRIFDWRTGRSTRKFPGKLHSSDHLSALSADGEHMTTVLNKGSASGIVIVETKTGKAVHTIALEERSSVRGLAFAGPNRFLALVSTSGAEAKTRVGVWDLGTQEVLADFPLEGPEKKRFGQPHIGDHGLAVSPGGKYFAVMLDDYVCVFETETGKLVGELKLPSVGSFYSSALTFTPDGEELMVIEGSNVDGATLYRVDVASGETTGTAKINAGEFNDVSYYQNLGRLQFLPELNCLLINGAFVVEPTTGETIYRIDAFKGMARVIGDRRVAGITSRARSSGFAEIRLPVAEIEKLAGVFQGGGKLLDGLWGEAKVASVDTAPTLRLPGTMTEWSLPAWANPPRVTGKKAITLPPPLDSSQAWNYPEPLFSATASHIAWLPRNDRANSRLFAINTATGRAEGDLDMLPATRLLEISPEGSLVIVAMGKRHVYGRESYERLDVFSIPLKKHVFAWRVGGAVESGPANRYGANPSLFEKAYFIEKSLVLTRMESGRLVLWKLPDATPVWRLDGDITIVGFSPDRSYVQLHIPSMNKYAWMEVRTGEWKGDLRAGERVGGASLAFSPDWKRTASLVSASGYTQLALGDVADPDGEGQRIELPPVNGPLTWLNERYVMATGSGVLFDAQTGAALWRVGSSARIHRSPEGTYWLSKHVKGDTTLTRTSFPSDKLFNKLKTAKGLVVKPIVGPGARVAVQSGFDTDEATQRQIALEFQKRGWILDPNGLFRINASMSQEPSTTKEYQNLLTGERSSVSLPGATIIQMSLTDAGGKVLWESKVHAGGGGYAPSIVTLREGESLQDKVGGNRGNGPRPQISSVPERIFPAKPFDSLPGMTLDEKGEQFE